MNQTLRPYPQYKDSRLPWLGKIPAHWDELRAKYFFREVDERSATGQEEMLSVSHITGVTPRSQKNVTMFKAESNVGHKLCHPSDLVINTMWAWMAALGVSKWTGIVSPSYAVYRPIRSDAFVPEYIDHLLRTKPYATEYLCGSTGIRSSRLRLYPDKFLEIPIICPLYQEQSQMLAFLNVKDRLIRRYISSKRQLIKLLNEHKQAIINQAVTCGLDPNVRLKPSGIDWLGDVPKHWDLSALKQLAIVRLSGVDKHIFEDEIPIRLCNYTDVYNCNFITSDIDFMPATAKEAEIAAFALRKGDVLITKDSEMWDDIAIPALVTQDLSEVLCGYHLALVRPDCKQIEAEYLFRAFSAPTIAQQFNVAANGVTRYGLSKHTIKNALFLVPPLEEQRCICQWISENIQPITLSLERARREIDLIREYRNRLIADVVTGKLDVRNVQLPDLEKAKELDKLYEIEQLEARDTMEIDNEEADDAQEL